MDFDSVFNEIRSWPVEQQIAIADKIYVCLLESGWEPGETPELLAELDRRLQSHRENPEGAITLEEFREEIRQMRKSIEEGLRDSEAGQTVTIEEIRAKYGLRQ